MSAKGFDDLEIDTEITRLAEERLQDDGRFAESYIHYRAGRGYGPLKIRAELNQRGVDEALSATLLKELDIDWSERIRAAWGKKFAHSATDFRERAKQARFLEYRGFTSDLIAGVLDTDTR